jgi:pyruvate dehydrogenase E2 component (dihydrolipoamide acetyltransferase)
VLATLIEPGGSAEKTITSRVTATPAPTPTPTQPQPQTAVADSSTAPALAAAAAVSTPSPERKAVSPAARARARELGIDTAHIDGTGAQGAVTLEDVMRAAAHAPLVRADRATEMRQAIAAAMSRSKREIPHYYLSETIPLTRAVGWLTRANETRPVTTRLLMSALQLKAVALALTKVPQLNGFWRGDKFQPVADVHIGVAIALRQGGLIAPAIHDVATKSVDQIMLDLTDLVKRVRAGSLRSSEMSDPTVTVTNLGDQGAETVFGVIYPPQVALLGFGRMEVRPWVENGALGVAPLVTATLSADHRASDGHSGARLLTELRELLQHPEDL